MLPSVTIIVHGEDDDAEDFASLILQTLQKNLTRPQARKIAAVWALPERPRDQLHAAALAVYRELEHYRALVASQSPDAHPNFQRIEGIGKQPIDDMLINLMIALDTYNAVTFVPTDRQVAYAATAANFYFTTAGKTLGDLLAPAELTTLVRDIIWYAQDRCADSVAPLDELRAAAEAQTMRNSVYGEFMLDGYPMDKAPEWMRKQAEESLPPGTTLAGFGRTCSGVLQVDYRTAAGTPGSTYRFNEASTPAEVTLAIQNADSKEEQDDGEAEISGG